MRSPIPADLVNAPVWPGPLKDKEPYKVLVADDDPVCLKMVAQMLKQCNYLVSTCTNGKDALLMLRDPAICYDLVLSDVYMPDMDGFRLLEQIGLEMDLPVIMMSSNGETRLVLRGVTHGAVDFLIKPVRIEELRNVWQHVVRRKRSHEGQRDSQSGDEGSDDTKRSERKRKERRDSDETGSAKKQRVVWNQEMHQQFVEAVQTLGVDKAVPKKILELMPHSNLTRENVASHLQKYRAALKRGLSDSQNPSSRHQGGFGAHLDISSFVPLAPPSMHGNAMDLATAQQLTRTAGGAGSHLPPLPAMPQHLQAFPQGMLGGGYMPSQGDAQQLHGAFLQQQMGLLQNTGGQAAFAAMHALQQHQQEPNLMLDHRNLAVEPACMMSHPMMGQQELQQYDGSSQQGVSQHVISQQALTHQAHSLAMSQPGLDQPAMSHLPVPLPTPAHLSTEHPADPAASAVPDGMGDPSASQALPTHIPRDATGPHLHMTPAPFTALDLSVSQGIPDPDAFFGQQLPPTHNPASNGLIKEDIQDDMWNLLLE